MWNYILSQSLFLGSRVWLTSGFCKVYFKFPLYIRVQKKKKRRMEIILQPKLCALWLLKGSFGGYSSLQFHVLGETFRSQAAAWHSGLMDPSVLIVPVIIVSRARKGAVLIVPTAKFEGSFERKVGLVKDNDSVNLFLLFVSSQ